MPFCNFAVFRSAFVFLLIRDVVPVAGVFIIFAVIISVCAVCGEFGGRLHQPSWTALLWRYLEAGLVFQWEGRDLSSLAKVLVS